MLELAILGLLKDKAMHGYELRKQLNSKLGHFWSVSFGSLYPTLRRLEARGAVETIFNEDEASRRKNIYRITERGEIEFLELIEDRAATSWEEDKFPLRLAFFRYLKPELRIRLLERRKAFLEIRLEGLHRSVGEGRSRIDSYTLSLLQHGVEQTRSDIAWLDDLIVKERRQIAEGAAPSEPARSTKKTKPKSKRTSERVLRETDAGPLAVPTVERAAARSAPSSK
ncbi:MAG: PadR family transcriptional regulator [Actinobacteria bacterium]|nr:PadR family transcriptional regulator [Actinomycetota bacterium]